MERSRFDARAIGRVAAVAAAALAISCSKEPTRPLAAIVHRTVAVVVSDSLGAPAPRVHVTLTGTVDSGGLVPVILIDTDSQGVASTVLAEGLWTAYALAPAAPPKVGAGTLRVDGASRPATDTVLVNLALHTPSVVRGRALLAGRTDHSGTIVSVGSIPSWMVTDSTGVYALDLLPVGRWVVVMNHLGFRIGLAAITISLPADTVEAGDVQMISDPNQNRVHPLGPGGPAPAGSRSR